MLRLGEDEVGWWNWWLVEQHLAEAEKKDGGKEGLEEGALFPLVEVCLAQPSSSLFAFRSHRADELRSFYFFRTQILSTLSALSPSPSTRFLSFRLLTRLITSCCGTEESGETTQLMLIREHVSETPYQPLRVAAIGMVKEILGEKFKMVDEVRQVSSFRFSHLVDLFPLHLLTPLSSHRTHLRPRRSSSPSSSPNSRLPSFVPTLQRSRRTYRCRSSTPTSSLSTTTRERWSGWDCCTC
jgi:hypothetical protein